MDIREFFKKIGNDLKKFGNIVLGDDPETEVVDENEALEGSIMKEMSKKESGNAAELIFKRKSADAAAIEFEKRQERGSESGVSSIKSAIEKFQTTGKYDKSQSQNINKKESKEDKEIIME